MSRAGAPQFLDGRIGQENGRVAAQPAQALGVPGTARHDPDLGPRDGRDRLPEPPPHGGAPAHQADDRRESQAGQRAQQPLARSERLRDGREGAGPLAPFGAASAPRDRGHRGETEREPPEVEPRQRTPVPRPDSRPEVGDQGGELRRHDGAERHVLRQQQHPAEPHGGGETREPHPESLGDSGERGLDQAGAGRDVHSAAGDDADEAAALELPIRGGRGVPVHSETGSQHPDAGQPFPGCQASLVDASRDPQRDLASWWHDGVAKDPKRRPGRGRTSHSPPFPGRAPRFPRTPSRTSRDRRPAAPGPRLSAPRGPCIFRPVVNRASSTRAGRVPARAPRFSNPNPVE